MVHRNPEYRNKQKNRMYGGTFHNYVNEVPELLGKHRHLPSDVNHPTPRIISRQSQSHDLDPLQSLLLITIPDRTC